VVLLARISIGIAFSRSASMDNAVLVSRGDSWIGIVAQLAKIGLKAAFSSSALIDNVILVLKWDSLTKAL